MSTRTLRYYEEIGLLKPERTPGNKRIYSKAEVVKVELIMRGKKYGFSLDEIKEIIFLFDKDRTGRKQLERMLVFGNEKISQMDEKIQELQQMKKEFELKMDEFNEKLDQLNHEAKK